MVLDKDQNISREVADGAPLSVLYRGGCCCQTPCAKVVNLLIMGQTGTGKTTLVDSFINYLLGIEFYDKFRYKLVDERKLAEERSKV